ncbi:19929_t:CDS:2, partial [Racocetra persica]
MNTNSANKYVVIPITQGTLEKIFLLDEDNKVFEYSFKINTHSSKKEVDVIEMILLSNSQRKNLADDNNKAKKELCKKLIRVDAIAKTLFADSHPDFILKYPIKDDDTKKEKRRNFIEFLLRAGL